MKDKDIYLLSASEIAEAVQTGIYTAREVAESFINRTEEIEPKVHAWVARNDGYVFDQADRVDKKAEKGPLAGVPFGIKDIFNTDVLPTCNGSIVWEEHKAGNDARCVSYIRIRDGVVAGKTDTAEFAVHSPNRAINPYNPDHVTGTSSGGSAVAVATAMAAAALGTQTGGSTIRPASWCGVYAMKPSFGLIPRTGVLKTTDTLDNIGFYGRSVADLRLILENLRVHGHNHPFIMRNLIDDKDRKRWKVGLCRTHLWSHAPEYAQESLLTFAGQLAALPGIEIVEAQLPDDTQAAHELHRRIYDPCLSYYFKEEVEKAPELISPRFMELVESGKKYSPDDYAKALRDQEQLSRKLHDYLKHNKLDLIISLSSNGSAPVGAEPSLNMDVNLLWTLCWMPVINLPIFKCPAGLPFGGQVITQRYGDLRLLTFLDYLVANQVIPVTGPVVDPK